MDKEKKTKIMVFKIKKSHKIIWGFLFMEILKIVFVIIGTLIGAGFASGQEIYIFFFSFGIKGLLGILISSIVIGITIHITLKLIKKNNVKDYKEFLDVLVKNEKTKEIINIIVNVFMLASFYIMIRSEEHTSELQSH